VVEAAVRPLPPSWPTPRACRRYCRTSSPTPSSSPIADRSSFPPSRTIGRWPCTSSIPGLASRRAASQALRGFLSGEGAKSPRSTELRPRHDLEPPSGRSSRGDLWASSTVGAGSRISFTVPRAPRRGSVPVGAGLDGSGGPKGPRRGNSEGGPVAGPSACSWWRPSSSGAARCCFHNGALTSRFPDLGIPGGKVEPGETPAAALVREIREELGCASRWRRLWRSSFMPTRISSW